MEIKKINNPKIKRCELCAGRGYLQLGACHVCRGIGKIFKSRTYSSDLHIEGMGYSSSKHEIRTFKAREYCSTETTLCDHCHGTGKEYPCTKCNGKREVVVDEEHFQINITKEDWQLIEDEGKARVKLANGLVTKGVVTKIESYGVVVEIGSKKGYIHKTEISNSIFNHPSEVLEVGQVVTVKVINYHPETGKLALSLKQVEGVC